MIEAAIAALAARERMADSLAGASLRPIVGVPIFWTFQIWLPSLLSRSCNKIARAGSRHREHFLKYLVNSNLFVQPTQTVKSIITFDSNNYKVFRQDG